MDTRSYEPARTQTQNTHTKKKNNKKKQPHTVVTAHIAHDNSQIQTNVPVQIPKIESVKQLTNDPSKEKLLDSAKNEICDDLVNDPDVFLSQRDDHPTGSAESEATEEISIEPLSIPSVPLDIMSEHTEHLSQIRSPCDSEQSNIDTNNKSANSLNCTNQHFTSHKTIITQESVCAELISSDTKHPTQNSENCNDQTYSYTIPIVGATIFAGFILICFWMSKR